MVLDREHTRIGYIGVAVTPDRIFALFSGRLLRDYPGNADLGRQVHVFSWTGELIQTIFLDSYVESIAVDESKQTLYGVRRDPYPALVTFKL